MGSIRVLSEQMANRIAAGEVVERPASVVKELAENALDAGASRLEVELQEGGKRLIRVTDDGCGMDAEDAALAVQRFATSKIRDPEDLERIDTMGFRGEALPSIASVSQMRITTRPPDAEEGTMLTVEGGEITDARTAGCPPGTTVEVANLFYNTPARRKFLRTTATERGHCTDWVSWLALARPDVAVKVVHDGTVLLTSPGRDDLRATVAEIYGSNVARQMVPVEIDTGAIRITGLVSRPDLTRTSRKHQVFIVNRRYVRSPALGHALSEAYGILLPSGKQPMCVLRLEVPPQLVDPNVHPTKIEVRFRNRAEVHNLAQQAVEEALQQAGLRPQSVRPRQAPADRAGRWEGPDAAAQMRARRLRVNPFAEQVDERDAGVEVHGDEPAGEAVFRPAKDREPELAPADRLEPLGQVAATYIACRAGEDLLLVDQHRAAERVIADRLSGERGEVRRQMLVLPLTLELTDAERAVIEEHRQALRELGFQVEPFGGGDYIVRSVPASLADSAVEEVLQGIVEELAEGGSAGEQARELLIATIACHAAVKAGQALTDREVHELIEALNASPTPAVCPHGDPIIVSVSRQEIDRRFRRT
ncbi:MAG: DNA mismatch repair endonuclease MutL [Armatimonadota bacterium]|nr:DNA mismatch repair endonuclease MutL [Armatimonadota bacterium]